MKTNHLLKTASLITLLTVILSYLFSCSYSGYRGDYKGAYTLAYTQIPDARGVRYTGPGFADPSIIQLETDSQGRALYLYLESTDGPLSLIIVQKEREEKVYFYPEESTLCFKVPDSLYDIFEKKVADEKIISLYNELCSADVLSAFKEQNDWDEPITEQKLDSADIILPGISSPWEYRKGDLTLSKEEWKKNLFAIGQKNGHNIPEDYLTGYNGINIYDNWMATDSYGRQLFYIEAEYCVYSEEGVFPSTYTWFYLEMFAIINPDGSYDGETFMIEIEDKLNFHDQLRELKDTCGWNQPLGEEAEQ